MKIQFDGWRRGNSEVSISEAIDGTIDSAGSDGGSVERVSDRTNKAASILGQLIQALHENGNLKDEQVAAMLGYRYIVEE